VRLLKFLGNHFRQFWKLWAAAAGTVVLIIRIYTPLAEAVGRWMSRQVVPLAGTLSGSLRVKDSAPTLIASGIITLSLVAVALCYTLYSLYQVRRAEKTGERRAGTLEKTFHRTQQAADKIWNRLFLGQSRPLKKVIKLRQVWTIYENGDCNFVETLALTTKDKDIHFMWKGVTAEQVAEPAEFPDDINLKIEPGGNGEIAYLISKNEPRSKHFIVFFLPFISAGGRDERELTISYYWKGLFRGLLVSGEEPFTYREGSANPIPEVEYQFWIKPKMGSLNCTNRGVNLGKDAHGRDIERLEPSRNLMGMSGWTYSARDLPGNHTTRLLLELRRT